MHFCASSIRVMNCGCAKQINFGFGSAKGRSKTTMKHVPPFPKHNFWVESDSQNPLKLVKIRPGILARGCDKAAAP